MTDVAPITERKRRMTMWDIKPQGYENVTSEQAKLSGEFPDIASLFAVTMANAFDRHVPTPWRTETGSYGPH